MATTTADEPTRRDFIYIATGAAGAVGLGLLAWPLIDQMNPSAAVLARPKPGISLAQMNARLPVNMDLR